MRSSVLFGVLVAAVVAAALIRGVPRTQPSGPEAPLTGTLSAEELELEFIDFGVDEVFVDEDGILLYAPFESFGAIQKELEKRDIEILSSGFERIPTTTTTLSGEAVEEVEKLLEKLEEDDDVQNVYHTMVLAE